MKGQIMRIESLQYFVVTANSNSMTLAGEILHVSQQSISKEIQLLEYELGVKLFTRSSKGVFLTKNGEIAYSSAITCLKSLNKFQNLFLTKTDLCYNIGYFLGIKSIISTLQEIFSALYPCATFNEFSLSTGQLWAELKEGNLDIIFHQIEQNQQKQLLQFQNYTHFNLLTEPLLILLHKNSPLHTIFPMKDISHYVFTFFSSSTNEITLYQEIAQRYGYNKKNIKANNMSKNWATLNNIDNAAFMTNSLLVANNNAKKNLNLKVLPVDQDIKILSILSIKNSILETSAIEEFIKISEKLFHSL